MAWLPAIVGMSFLQDAHPVQANMLEDFTRKAMRPDLEYMQALIMLLDARSVLREVELVAASPSGSDERRQINPRLPGIAKRLRRVGEAAPVVAATVFGTEKEQNVSGRYGGFGDNNNSTVDDIYASVGAVLTLTGRGVRPELVKSENPRVANAIQTISLFLDKVPSADLEAAESVRRSR